MITQYTTPTLTITITPDDIITSEVIADSSLFLTIKQKVGSDWVEITKEATASDNVLEVTLSQNDTGTLSNGVARMQIRGVTTEGFAWATKTYAIDVDAVLHEGVIKRG